MIVGCIPSLLGLSQLDISSGLFYVWVGDDGASSGGSKVALRLIFRETLFWGCQLYSLLLLLPYLSEYCISMRSDSTCTPAEYRDSVLPWCVSYELLFDCLQTDTRTGFSSVITFCRKLFANLFLFAELTLERSRPLMAMLHCSYSFFVSTLRLFRIGSCLLSLTPVYPCGVINMLRFPLSPGMAISARTGFAILFQFSFILIIY